MSSTFEGCLQTICQDFLLKKEDRTTYNKDAEGIRNYVMDRMKETDSGFKKAFRGLSLTGSYLDRLKIELPDEFDLHIKLEMPFTITPTADMDRPGFVKLNVGNGVNHRIVENRAVSRIKLQDWIREIMTKAIGSGLTLEVPEKRQYKLSYPDAKRGHGVAHTVVATGTGVGNDREISFDFVPVFEFSGRNCPLTNVPYHDGNLPWFTVPQGRKPKDYNYRHTFKACAPHWERSVFQDKMNLKNSLRLMKALRNANDMPRLTSYMLKSVYLMELDNRTDDYWQQPMGQILVDMLTSLVRCFEINHLPFYLDDDLNHLDLLPYADRRNYERVLKSLLSTLKQYKDQRNVQCAYLAKIFGA